MFFNTVWLVRLGPTKCGDELYSYFISTVATASGRSYVVYARDVKELKTEYDNVVKYGSPLVPINSWWEILRFFLVGSILRFFWVGNICVFSGWEIICVFSGWEIFVFFLGGK